MVGLSLVNHTSTCEPERPCSATTDRLGALVTLATGWPQPTSGVTGSPSLTTSATTTSSVGSYPISASLETLRAANYAFTFAGGTLSIMYAPVGLACYGDAGHQVLQPMALVRREHEAHSRLQPSELAARVELGVPGRVEVAVGEMAEIGVVLDAVTGRRIERRGAGHDQRRTVRAGGALGAGGRAS